MRIVFFLVIGLIAYGSLFPFRFVAYDLSHIDWWHWLFDFSARTTRGDILGNVLLFLPVGFFGALAIEQISTSRSVSRGLSYGALVVLGLVYAFVLQVAQLYLPSRIASASDAFSNFAGLLMGILASRLAFSRWWASWLQSEERASQVIIPLILCFCWLGYLWFPFLPSLAWKNLAASVESLSLWQQVTWYGVLDKLVAWTLFWGFFSKVVPWQEQWWHRLTILSFILLGQILVVRNHLSLINCSGAILSLLLFTHLRRLPARWLAFGLLGWLVVRGLFPFQIAEQAQPFYWLPFAGFLQGPLWLYSFILFEKLFFFGACFYWLQRAVTNKVLACALLSGTLLLLELLQLGLLHHSAEVTDPLIALLLAIGLIHLQKISAAQSHNTFEKRGYQARTTLS